MSTAAGQGFAVLLRPVPLPGSLSMAVQLVAVVGSRVPRRESRQRTEAVLHAATAA